MYKEDYLQVNQYDENDNLIQTLQGGFIEVFSNIPYLEKYYFRDASIAKKTNRQRVNGKHFGVNVSCIGGLEFSLEETYNRRLNRFVSFYAKNRRKNYVKNGISFRAYHGYCEYLSEFIDRVSENSSEELQYCIDTLIASFPMLEEVHDLNIWDNKQGIYLLVLDRYNVCYLGQSNNIKRRIMRHWSRIDYFWGLGIDLFKALDTTRIFACEVDSNQIDEVEYEMIKLLPSNLTLNLIQGGGLDYLIQNGFNIKKSDDS